MEEEKANAVLEGCHLEEPSRINYEPVEIFIPENAQVLRINNYRLFLYGNFDKFEYSSNKVLIPSRKSLGWQLTDKNTENPFWIDLVFGSSRSITNSNGKVYISEAYYEPRWEWYFSLVPMILSDCHEFFSGKKTRDELTAIVRRAF